MLRRLTPAGIHPPFANYCHATLAPAGARWLYVSGQLGIRPDGVIPERFEDQAEACFENIALILAEAGMGAADLVRLNSLSHRPRRSRRLHAGARSPRRRSATRLDPAGRAGAGAAAIHD